MSIYIAVSSYIALPFLPSKIEIPETEGQAFVEEMQVGWNLGCSLESFYQDTTGMQTETMWGNPKTTQAMIDMVKEAGFKTIRIPITWYPHMNGAPDYTIDEEWMNRVQEVVDYAYGIGMYVIINVQNDNHDWLIPNKANWEATAAQYTAIWEQICERFGDYDNHLIYESTNEPRVVGSILEWNGGFPEEREYVNKLNMLFVEVVRAAGGNDAERYLMLPTHGASHTWVDLNAMELPENDDKIIVSIHSYYPYRFTSGKAEDMGVKTWGTMLEKYDLEHMLALLYDTFVKKGIPVYMDEFGAAYKENDAERAEWAEFYVKTAKKYGIGCNWWDNGLLDINNESFVLLNRAELKWEHKEVVDAIIKAAH